MGLMRSEAVLTSGLTINQESKTSSSRAKTGRVLSGAGLECNGLDGARLIGTVARRMGSMLDEGSSLGGTRPRGGHSGGSRRDMVEG